jgi:hypothetical protein
MTNRKLVYAKHTPQDRCGVAYFGGKLARLLDAKLVHSFHGFGTCEEFYVNLDIWELTHEDIQALEYFMRTGNIGKRIVLMHDYRFSHLEDTILGLADVVVNLSGEPALNKVAKCATIPLFTPPLTEPSTLGLRRTASRPLSMAFGFFNARKKSFRTYISFYEFMSKKFPDWTHIVVASAHTGHDNRDKDMLERLVAEYPVTVLDFIPNSILSELVHAADLGVCFYPTGIMWNNTAPMSFFQQKKPVLTSFGELTPPEYKKFLLNVDELESIPFNDSASLSKRGEQAFDFFQSALSWDVFCDRLRQTIASAHKA